MWGRCCVDCRCPRTTRRSWTTGFWAWAIRSWRRRTTGYTAISWARSRGMQLDPLCYSTWAKLRPKRKVAPRGNSGRSCLHCIALEMVYEATCTAPVRSSVSLPFLRWAPLRAPALPLPGHGPELSPAALPAPARFADARVLAGEHCGRQVLGQAQHFPHPRHERLPLRDALPEGPALAHDRARYGLGRGADP